MISHVKNTNYTQSLKQIVKDNYKLDTTCPEFMRYSFNSRSLCHRKTY